MNLQENINRINEIILKLDTGMNNPEDKKEQSYYSPDLNILSKSDFDYTTGYFAGNKGTKYIVGDDKPIGEFRFVHIDDMTPGFDLYEETPRNWHRCISMLGPILKDLINTTIAPKHIIFSPDTEKQQKRYQSKELIDYILEYIGDKYTVQIVGVNVYYIKK